MAEIGEEKTDPSGLVLSSNETIYSFLFSASTNPDLPEELRETASNLSSQGIIPYKRLREIWTATQTLKPGLIQLLSGSEIVLTSPKPREKSEELKARLRKLEEMAERRTYQELVKDITPKKETDEPFSSYKDQLGFGLHVGLTMFTGYLVGYAAFRALFSHNPAMNAAGGILGLVGGMLVETFLFIIRTSSKDRRAPSAASKVKKNQ